jgi:hypothetical protein
VASSVLMRFNNASVLIVNSLLSILIFIIVNRMKPELSINYNSNSGNGLLGVGFGLGGLSAIHRCPILKAPVVEPTKAEVSIMGNDSESVVLKA